MISTWAAIYFYIAVTVSSVFTTAIWYLIYTYILKSYKTEAEFTSRIVAAIHATIAIFLSFICIVQGPDPLTVPGEPNTWLHNITMTISLGYFVYDLWWCVKHQPEPRIILLHHVASIMAIFMVLIYGKSGGEAVGGLGSLECTNPILQARWFLRTYGYNNTPMHTAVEGSFIVLFLIMRLGYGTKLTYSVVFSDNVMMALKICTLLLYVISIIFIYFIGQFVVRKYVFCSPTQCSEYICEPDCEHKQIIAEQLSSQNSTHQKPE